MADLELKFSVADSNTLLSTDDSAFDQLAGPFPGAFDWGLAFFYGRNVFTSIDGASVRRWRTCRRASAS